MATFTNESIQMPLIRWSANRIISILLYISVISLTAWAGIGAINYSLDSKFYKDFLVKWEISIKKYNQMQAQWPPFTGSNHTRYMARLTGYLQHNQVAVPESNTQFPYIYIMDRHGWNQKQHQIFVLCFSDKLVLYNVPEETFDRIDRFIDSKPSPFQGRLQGRPDGKDTAYTCVWKL